MPTPYIIDESENAESQEVNIEARMEYTVVFPGTDQVLPTNGGYTTQEKFRKEVVDAMDRTSQTTVISRPTPNRLIDYKGDALLRAFPLQFPYGIGLPPQKKNNRNDSKEVAISKIDYLNHSSHQSIKHSTMVILFWCSTTCTNGNVQFRLLFYDAKTHLVTILSENILPE
jgi:hypothetical protein